MRSINLKHVQAVGERLLEQISIMTDLLEEVNQTERSIRGMSFTQQTIRLLEQSRVELEEEIRILRQMSECLMEVVQVYRDAEQRITDVYDMEIVCYPSTKFGVSKITGLTGYEELIPFR